MKYKLTLLNHVDGLTQSKWIFDPPVTVGRDPNSGVCVDHKSISRQHCQFTLDGDQSLVVRDLNSMNGIYVDDNRVSQKVLMPNEIIQVGSLRLQVEFVADDEPVHAPTPRRYGSMDVTQPMTTIPNLPPPPKKSWWQKIFG